VLATAVLFGKRALLLRVQPKRLELPTPFRRSIAQPLDIDAPRQAALHGSADQLGSKKGERDGHVDMMDAASLADLAIATKSAAGAANGVKLIEAAANAQKQSDDQ
jgi:hypothetical protein